MKMLMMLVVAAILFCSHHQVVVASEVVEVMCNEGNELAIWPWDIPCYLSWPFPFPRPYPCPPPRPRPPPPPQSSPPPPPSPPPPAPATSCSASDKEKIRMCMFNTTSIDEFYLIFKSILGTSCPCYKYADDLDNQVLITLKAYCDVDSPCRGVPSPPPSPPKSSCSASDQEKVKTCMFNTTSVDACCPTFKSILGTSCPYYKYADDLDNQVLITLEAYCDIDSPCRDMPSPPPPPPKLSCSASDQEKVKTCMVNTTSIDECCPTFQSILGTSCPCYKYAEDLDNQVLITLEAYCDVTSPCKGVQSPPPPPPKSSCSASDQEKVKTCMFNTTSINECCPTFQSILGSSCPCYKYAEDLDNQVLITLEAYCDVTSPCKGVHSPPPLPPKSSCSASDQEKVKTCMFNTTSIDECCPTFQSILGTSCPCYKYAEDLDNQVLITLEAYCDVTSPCKGVHSPPPLPPKSSCSASDQEKVKTCMFNTTSIDECCPTFQSILGTSCPCYKYAEDLDNQVLITLEAYCDVTSPCKGVHSPPPLPPKSSCSASDQEKVKTCMFNTTSIDECCPTFQSILGTSCPCYKYAEDLDNQVLITLEAYCDVTSPCKGVHSPPPLPPKSSCSASDQEKVKTCMFNTTSIDECCPTFQSILGTSCPCYKYAEDLDNQVLITLEAYCDVTSPCKGVHSPPPLPPKSSCSASDQEKVKTCMFNTTSIDECCPTFQSILGTSCPCYKYAEDLDNQVLITLEAYCDVTSPCKGVHSPPPLPPKSSCSASDQEKVKTCMFNTTSIDECCPTFQSILGTSCPCYKYAEDLDNQVLITLEAYCDVTSPCKGVHSPPPLPPKSSCSASDQEKVKTCMFNTTSIDECCPTFQSVLGTSCPCYKYAEDLDNRVLITFEAYCDITSPCKGMQVIKLSKDDE